MNEKRLMTYNPMSQHMGTWLLGYNWNIYGCGTYAEPVTVKYAQVLMRRFIERLDNKMHAPISYFAALERRTSGCGMSEIPLHWHFLAACRNSVGMARTAQYLWNERFGNAKIDPYDRNGNAPYYVCKLVDHVNGDMLFEPKDLPYEGPSDLLAAARLNPYVPNHLKDKVFGKYLVVRGARVGADIAAR